MFSDLQLISYSTFLWSSWFLNDENKNIKKSTLCGWHHRNITFRLTSVSSAALISFIVSRTRATPGTRAAFCKVKKSPNRKLTVFCTQLLLAGCRYSPPAVEHRVSLLQELFNFDTWKLKAMSESPALNFSYVQTLTFFLYFLQACRVLLINSLNSDSSV